MMRNLSILFFIAFFYSCSTSKQIAKSAQQNVLTDSALLTAHVGISIYEPATGRYWYNHQGDKYFVPASNTKIPTCYAAMKYLGDSLVGLRYAIPDEVRWKKNLVIDATGDPTFLHNDFKNQVVFDSLLKWCDHKKKVGFLIKEKKVERWGNGWSWNDYDANYMAERSTLPIFGNLININLLDTSLRLVKQKDYPWQKEIRLFYTGVSLFDSLLRKTRPPINKKFAFQLNPQVQVERDIAMNVFSIKPTQTGFKSQQIPFVTNDYSTALEILADTLKTNFAIVEREGNSNRYSWATDDGDIELFHVSNWNTIHSQPTDSLLKPMMHRSDNFFAEQSLLMVSNEMLGVMNDAKIIDTILKTDFKDLPQKPRWADGSGLSRYNLFTPQDLVFILNKMKNEFGMDRIKEILPTGNEGTLSNYYKAEQGDIFAKTGTLSGVVAFSGFLYTKKNKLLIFSVLVNNHQASATQVRRAVEKFIEGIRNKY